MKTRSCPLPPRNYGFFPRFATRPSLSARTSAEFKSLLSSSAGTIVAIPLLSWTSPVSQLPLERLAHGLREVTTDESNKR